MWRPRFTVVPSRRVSRSRSCLLIVAVLATTVVHVRAVPVAAARARPAAAAYVPPVDGRIIDRFRPPAGPYGAGNRGLDYLTRPLSEVRASADGEVIFAGAVAGTLHITVRHPDGLRSTYSFVATILVRRGQRVHQGERIALSGELFHFGVRDPAGEYLDPEALFVAGVVVRLVPGGDDGSAAAQTARELALARALVRTAFPVLVEGFNRAVGTTISPQRALDRLRLLMHYARELRPETHAARLARARAVWQRQAAHCTPAANPMPRPTGRRILVEVAGIGSTSENASVERVDAAAIGYARGDVVRFSYRGGRVPDDVAAEAHRSIAVTTYDARDSQNDLDASAARLTTLLRDLAAESPGVPIDVVAHSQGGVVARASITHASIDGTLPPSVASLVTLGTPHQGTNAATAIAAIDDDPSGAALLQAVRGAIGLELDPALPSGRQLAQGSETIRWLRAHPVPASVRFTSIAARGDLVVPAGRTETGDALAFETVVPLTGLHAHDELPADGATTRELVLAVHGLPPTCRTLVEVTKDIAVSDTISWVEDRAAVTALGGVIAVPP